MTVFNGYTDVFTGQALQGVQLFNSTDLGTGIQLYWPFQSSPPLIVPNSYFAKVTLGFNNVITNINETNCLILLPDVTQAPIGSFFNLSFMCPPSSTSASLSALNTNTGGYDTVIQFNLLPITGNVSGVQIVCFSCSNVNTPPCWQVSWSPIPNFVPN